MSAPSLIDYAPGSARKATEWIAGIAVIALGVGLILLLDSLGNGSLVRTMIGGALAAGGLVALIGLGMSDGLSILTLSLPLPAFFASSDARIAPAAIITLLVLLGWFVAWGPTRRPIRFPKAFRASWGALLLALLVSAVFAQHPVAAAREFVNWGLFLGLFVVAVDIFTRHPERIHAMALVVAATAGLAGFAAVLQSLSVLPATFPMNGTSFNRATLGFGWPNELAVFFALGVPFAVYAVQVSRGKSARLLALLALASAGLGLLTTFSRGSWLALVVATLALVLVGSAGFVVRAVVLGVVSAALLDVAAGGVFSARAGTLIDDPSVLQRAALQLVGLLMFRAHPIVGVGPGGFAESLEEYGPQVAGLYDYVGTAHNVYLDMAAETGALGLLAFLWFLVAAFRVLLKVARSPESPAAPELRRALFWSFSVAILVGFTAWPFAHGLGQLVFLVLAAGISLQPSAAVPTPMRRRTMDYAASSG